MIQYFVPVLIGGPFISPHALPRMRAQALRRDRRQHPVGSPPTKQVCDVSKGRQKITLGYRCRDVMQESSREPVKPRGQRRTLPVQCPEFPRCQLCLGSSCVALSLCKTILSKSLKRNQSSLKVNCNLRSQLCKFFLIKSYFQERILRSPSDALCSALHIVRLDPQLRTRMSQTRHLKQVCLGHTKCHILFSLF